MRSDELLMLSYRLDVAICFTQKGKTSTQIESIKLTLHNFITVLRLIIGSVIYKRVNLDY